ncbi:pentapeptide repeat-containing protein [Micromonospora sp. 067-2]|uniref:pentapeptide repeat-containing protein n=1 Tax=Micromonospora sp. 067-2 TaxID=2789270 RepID=UPI00397CAC47
MPRRIRPGTLVQSLGLALLIAGATLAASPWQWNVWPWLVRHPATFVMAAGLGIFASVRSRRLIAKWSARGKGGMQNSERAELHWILSDVGIGSTTTAVALVGVAALIVMLAVAKSASPGNEQAKLQMEAIKYGLGFVASGGALAALLLAVRRQRLAERSHELAVRAQELATRSHEHTESDATERRVTELYSKAVEQLGSSSAAVRLGGLYSLERVAQGNPPHRQSIVDIICAYLRMPFDLPTGAASGNPDLSQRAEVKDAREELLVRRAAQDMLARHLKKLSFDTGKAAPSLHYWGRLNIDLSGASLHDLDLWHCHVEDAIFTGANFYGHVQLHGCTFDRRAFFSGATVYGTAYIVACEFDGVAWFDDATFHGNTYFEGSNFAGYVTMENCLLEGNVDFDDVNFRKPPAAKGIVFKGQVKNPPEVLRPYAEAAEKDR